MACLLPGHLFRKESCLRSEVGGWGFGRAWEDKTQRFEGLEGVAGDKEPLGVGAGVGRDQEEALRLVEGLEQGGVDLDEPFESVPVSKAEPDPQALCTGAADEAAAVEPLGGDCVGEIEVADVGDPFDLAEGKWSDAGCGVDELDLAVARRAVLRQIAPGELAGKTADDDLLLG